MLHEYFQNQQCNVLQLLPTADCLALSKNLNIQWRSVENRLTGMIKESGENEPFVNGPSQKWFRKYYGDKVFRFYIKLKDPSFLNYTNVDLASAEARKVFYFNNLSKNRVGGKSYLSAPIKEYSLNKTYLPGNLVRDAASGNIFEAIKKHILKKKTSLTDQSLWIQKGLLHLAKPVEDHAAGKAYNEGDFVRKAGTDSVFEATKRHTSVDDADLNNNSLWLARDQGLLQYPTENDALDLTAGSYQFAMPSAIKKAEITISAFNYDPANPAYDKPILTVTRNFEKDASQVGIDFSGLKPGKYQVAVNKETRFVYFDPFVSPANTFGVIEIFNHLPGLDDYALLTDEEKLKSARYTIHFPFRRVLWKYVRKDGKAQTITDVGETGYVFNLDGDNFISAIPLPLSEAVCKTLKLEFNTKDFRMFPLPNPQVNRLGRYNQNDFDYFCSEVYLNY